MKYRADGHGQWIGDKNSFSKVMRHIAYALMKRQLADPIFSIRIKHRKRTGGFPAKPEELKNLSGRSQDKHD
ncbi:hypothetical protein [Desulfosarcina cetonica]|uniref:hypothetical protein n=1 Tax=Desulfosarcina cetonica TaxID=90730 RepID=UPI0012EE234B|nr:hypothetical protein [Desulfosarcina cetonica]